MSTRESNVKVMCARVCVRARVRGMETTEQTVVNVIVTSVFVLETV